MHSIHYQALREAAQNYQSMLAWYEAIPDSPDAEVDCDEALSQGSGYYRRSAG